MKLAYICLFIHIHFVTQADKQRDSMANEGQHEVHLAEGKMNYLPKYSQKKGKATFQRQQYILLGEK